MEEEVSVCDIILMNPYDRYENSNFLFGQFFFMNYYIYCGADFKVDIKIDRKDEIDGASARGAVDA